MQLQDKALLGIKMKTKTAKPQFVICIDNQKADDLELWKVYQVLPDEQAAQDNYLRVIDESGEDYLYPAEHFVLIELPEQVERLLLSA
jgi:hypothetical protein